MISVIIPCYNAEEHIEECLRSLLEQSRPPDEILVVDDASTDRSAALAARFPVKIIRRPRNGGAGAARSEGANAAAGDILVFLDSDCVAPRGWLRRAAAVFDEDPGLIGLVGRCAAIPDGTLMGGLCNREEDYVYHQFSLHPEMAVLGGNCAFRKSAWNEARSGRELRYFPGMASGEDSLVFDELRRAGRVRYDPELKVAHHARGGAGYLKRHFNRGLSRSTIMLHRLTAIGDSLGALKAHGGWQLLAASLLLGLAPWALLSGRMLLAAACLAGHALLSLPFFSFVRRANEELPAGERAGIGRRLGFRGLLLARSACWALGGGLGVLRAIGFRAMQCWRAARSILHFWLPGRISKLFFFVTARCNARCAFCFNLENVVNWKARQPQELSLDEIVQIAKGLGRLPYLTLSGGEPFIRADLPELIHAFYRHAKTQWVTIPSNGALVEQTSHAVREILGRCPGIFLTVQISIDSLFEEHDKSRVLPGAFARLSETLKRLAVIRRYCGNLRIQIATCYGEFNEKRIEEITRYCRDHFEYDQQMFYLIRKPPALITEENRGLIAGYMDHVRRHNESEWRRHRRTLWSRAARALQALVYQDIEAITSRQEFLRPCFATQKFVTLYDDGQVSPCEVLEKTRLGNIRDFGYDFYRLKKEQALDRFHREEIVKKKCNCDWICAVPNNILYDVKALARVPAALLDPGGAIAPRSGPPRA